MSDVLEEFEYRRSLLQNMNFHEARARISGFLEWLQKEPKIASIIDDIEASVKIENILKEAPPNASTPEEIAAVGLHLMLECLAGEEPWKLSHAYGIEPSYSTSSVQDYLDEAFDSLILLSISYKGDLRQKQKAMKFWNLYQHNLECNCNTHLR